MRHRDDLKKHQARAVSQICGAYVLKALMATASVLDHDYSLAVVYTAIVQANVGPVFEDPDLAARYGAVEAVVPDDLRRPVSVHALSLSLQMPYETTRRTVGRLINKGFVRRVSRNGVASLADKAADPALLRGVERNYLDALRMIDQLKASGVSV